MYNISEMLNESLLFLSSIKFVNTLYCIMKMDLNVLSVYFISHIFNIDRQFAYKYILRVLIET